MDSRSITEDLVTRLIADQFPQWAHLTVRRVEPGGNDNRTFRVGDEFSARLPSAEGYVAAVEKEHRYLPRLAAAVPVAIPEPVALGEPGHGYPWPWTVNRWMPGRDLLSGPDIDRRALAADLAGVLVALRRADAADGPAAGAHSFFRGAPPEYYDEETRRLLAELGGVVASEVLREAQRVWDAALESRWGQAPVWFHGDVAHGNLLVSDGRLSGLIDFGTSGVGDPACDLVMAWTYFDDDDRRLFVEAVDLDAGTWARARGWALWKALLIARERGIHDSGGLPIVTRVLADPIAE
ncbi:aminoglycoside phosphotransferase family protein [Antiquaquibacter soli]|uniref:Aminoglycoside phosphotransferase family protein n=1 Tax=Antiquaquibacter soli TaxID=3064523 RepID=A0ABT9BMN2_9MICO|nr:aminoglycoside phosphotransferase family protein [Protaetiibacter sp. WY-16]MDO7882289.1 aminoglycoside phosphotransferase family protein [Protaetiibacter sp. WY-16]